MDDRLSEQHQKPGLKYRYSRNLGYRYCYQKSQQLSVLALLYTNLHRQMVLPLYTARDLAILE